MMEEILLTGGRTTTDIVRIGNTVRRPVKPRAKFTQALLHHFEMRGFTGAPKFLGMDETNREMLSYLPGSAPSELGHFSDEQLTAAARLLRELHDSTVDFPLRGDHEIVCHGDASPCNCVFENDIPRAFIDFDTSHPGSRLEDLGYAAWLWIDVGNEQRAADHQGRRIAGFFQAYGLRTADAVASIISAQMALAERTDSAEVRKWSNTCRMWVERKRTEIVEAIAEATHNAST